VISQKAQNWKLLLCRRPTSTDDFTCSAFQVHFVPGSRNPRAMKHLKNQRSIKKGAITSTKQEPFSKHLRNKVSGKNVMLCM
jgi:hypothetical protein